MIDALPIHPSLDSLNSYNVQQLQFALSQSESKVAEIDPLSLDNVHLLPHSFEIDYSTRRMSSSGTSDSSSVQSKRPASPSASPLPKRARPDADSPWSGQDTPDLQPSGLSSSERDPPSADSPARVQLPSLASTFNDHHEQQRRASLPTLYSDSTAAHPRLPFPIHRPSQSASGLSSYQFPPPDAASSPDDRAFRPRLAADTQVGLYPGPVSEFSLPTPALSTSPSSFSFSPVPSEYSAGSSRPSFSFDSDSWQASSIARPSSTPGSLPGQFENLRAPSFGGPQQMYGGVTRISGHSDRSARNNAALSAIKTESDWTFPPNDFNMSSTSSPSGMPASASSNPSISVSGSPNRSPQAGSPGSSASTLVDRTSQAPPQTRKRGKLPKQVTDFLKDWLHSHSDHPYPSEEEKKHLCNVTGLSMSQVSNWMINARRRILAPARHSTAGPTTTTPFGARSGVGMPGMVGGMTSPLTGPSVLDTGRRASMPTDTLQLYYPMSLQSLTHDHMSQSSTRQMVGMTRSLSSSHAPQSMALGHHGHGQSPYGLSDSYNSSRLSYGGNGGSAALHPSSHHSATRSSPGGYFGMSNSSSASFLGSQSGMYGSAGSYAQNHSHNSSSRLSPDDSVGSRYFAEGTASPGP